MRASIQFARQRSEVIDHLAINVFPANQARAETQFKPMIDKIISELHGTIEVREIETHGNVWKKRVVVFPDKSSARMPTLQDLRKRIREVNDKIASMDVPA